MKRIYGLPVFLLGAAALTSTLTHGQAISSNGGSIQGTITDASGAVVPNAAIVIKGTDTGFTRTSKSDSAGFYSVGPLQPGNYSVTVTEAGFQKLAVKTVVKTGTVTSGSFKLTIGSSDTTIDVNAGALQINTDQAGVSDVVSRAQIEALPINGRNFLDVAQLEPGVLLESGETFDPTKAGYSAISLNGISGRSTRILLDGQDITDETVGTTIMNVTTGAIDEFQLNRSTQDVSGEVTSTGQLLVSTRSGTNSIHGQLLYNFQDYRVGAAPTTGGYNAPFQRNQFGGSIGGPIIKDKLFFFGDSERIKQDAAGSATTGPTFAKIQAQFPTIPSPFRDTYSTIRIDYNAPHSIHLFVRGAYDVNSAFSNFGDLYSLYQSRNNVPALVGGVDLVTGRFTHSIRGGYEKFHNVLGDGTAGLTSIYNPGLLIGTPVTLDDSQDGFYAGANFLAPQGTFQSDKQLRYDGTWTRGSHSVKFGAAMNRLLGGGFAEFYGKSLYTAFGASNALASCKGAAGAAPCTSDPVNGYAADYYLLGNGNGFFTEKSGFGLKGGGLQDWRSSAYIADSWKVTQSFTAIFGVRWSIDTDRANQDLPTPTCASVTAVTSAQLGCSGSTPLWDQYQAGLGYRTNQPLTNFGPQVGFVFSPGAHKTSIRMGIGIFYESDLFNNTSNSRSEAVNANGNYFGVTPICGPYGTSVVFPNGSTVTSINGVSLATVCSQSIAKAAPQINALKAQLQTASSTGGPNPSYVGGGGGLNLASTSGVYAGPYQTPYSIQINGGLQHELRKGTILTVDYVHNASIKIGQLIDTNRLGAARSLNVAGAKAAIAATLAGCGATSINAALAPNGCPTGTGPNGNASIIDFASNGLDSSAIADSGYPNTVLGKPNPAAFPGLNPKVGAGYFILPTGRSAYDALQMVLKQDISHPTPWIASSNVQVSYSLSRVVNAINPGSGQAGAADQFFSSYAWDDDHINQYMGRSNLDHSEILNFGAFMVIKAPMMPSQGLKASVIGHFYSAAPTTLLLDSTAGNPGEIFRTDVTGDGTVGDIVPGTNPGYYMHQIKGPGLNTLINNYNAKYANTPTPAGLALINAGLVTYQQLVALNGVQQPIATVPTVPLQNSAHRNLDLSFSYPVALKRFREGLSIEPGCNIYNALNMSNFGSLGGVLANTTDAGGTVGSVNNFLNGPNDLGVKEGLRSQRASGTFDQNGPRTTEFTLRVNF